MMDVQIHPLLAVGREVDTTLEAFGRIQMKQIMLYEVKNGRIVLE